MQTRSQKRKCLPENVANATISGSVTSLTSTSQPILHSGNMDYRGCNVAEKGRSEVADPEYGTSVKYSVPLEIDFDEASRLWNANKKKISNGCYQYVCGIPLENEKFCKRKICKTGQYCSMHKTI